MKGVLNMSEEAKVLLCGDSAVTVQFGETAKISINQKVRAFEQLLLKNKPRGILETIPTYRSLMIYYDPLTLQIADLRQYLLELAGFLSDEEVQAENEGIRVPVWYQPPGSEIEMVAEYENKSVEKLSAFIHSMSTTSLCSASLQETLTSAVPKRPFPFLENPPPPQDPMPVQWLSGPIKLASAARLPHQLDGTVLGVARCFPMIPAAVSLFFSNPVSGSSSMPLTQTSTRKLNTKYGRCAMCQSCININKKSIRGGSYHVNSGPEFRYRREFWQLPHRSERKAAGYYFFSQSRLRYACGGPHDYERNSKKGG